MTEEEEMLLMRKWEYTNVFKTFGNVMGKMEGFGVLDFSKEGVLILRDNMAEFKYTLVDRSLEIFLTADRADMFKLRICELTADKLVIAIGGKVRDGVNDEFREIVELTYAPIDPF